jgi:release factor glutamine methyltransferase
MSTVEGLLRTGVERLRAAGSETPRLDAELLLGHAIGADRTVVVAHPEASVGEGAAARYGDDLARRERGEPVAYIRGFKEFFGLAFATDGRALIPRPETERVVELAEREIVRRLTAAPRSVGAAPLRIVDVGTGCGTIAVALGVTLRRRRMLADVEIIGTDDSVTALELARENAVGHVVGDRVRFLEADLLPPVIATPFDLLLANLPYVRSEVVDRLPVAASFEPRHALDGGPDGLSVIRRLLDRLPDALAPGGVGLLEIGADQADEIGGAVAAQLPYWTITIETDLAGLPRVARIAPPPPDTGAGGAFGGD